MVNYNNPNHWELYGELYVPQPDLYDRSIVHNLAGGLGPIIKRVKREKEPNILEEGYLLLSQGVDGIRPTVGTHGHDGQSPTGKPVYETYTVIDTGNNSAALINGKIYRAGESCTCNPGETHNLQMAEGTTSLLVHFRKVEGP